MELNVNAGFEKLDGMEIAGKRGRCEKHFDLGGGRREAILYPYAVHYKAEDGSRSTTGWTRWPGMPGAAGMRTGTIL